MDQEFLYLLSKKLTILKILAIFLANIIFLIFIFF